MFKQEKSLPLSGGILLAIWPVKEQLHGDHRYIHTTVYQLQFHTAPQGSCVFYRTICNKPSSKESKSEAFDKLQDKHCSELMDTDRGRLQLQ